MNCEDYRAAVAAEPSACNAEAEQHADGCVECRQFRKEMLMLDRQVSRALAIDVPELRMPELPAAVDSHPHALPGIRRRRPPGNRLPVWIGLAAGFIVAGFFAVSLLTPDADRVPLAEQVIAHMDHEQSSRQVTSIAVPEAKLQSVIASDVEEMDARIGLVSYAKSCPINGKVVPHLVIQGASGPITLILMADEEIDRAIPLSGTNVHGVIVPVGKGSIAIIGERKDQLEEISTMQDEIASSVRWRI